MKTTIAVWMVVACAVAGPVKWQDKIATVETRGGVRHEHVRVAQLDEQGLMYFHTNAPGGGRVALDDIAPKTQADLGIEASVAELKSARAKRAADAAEARSVAGAKAVAAEQEKQQAARAKEVEDLMAQATGRHRVFEAMEWSGGVLVLDVGTVWRGFTLKEKKAAAEVAFMYGRMKSPTMKLVRVRDAYSGKVVGRYFPDSGLEMD